MGDYGGSLLLRKPVKSPTGFTLCGHYVEGHAYSLHKYQVCFLFLECSKAELSVEIELASFQVLGPESWI